MLSLYRFNTGIARHLFCKRCGVLSFYVPRSNPDGVAITSSCIEKGTFTALREEQFDGQNWEESILSSSIRTASNTAASTRRVDGAAIGSKAGDKPA